MLYFMYRIRNWLSPGRVTQSDLRELEHNIMTALSVAVAGLSTAVESAVARLGNVAGLQAALADERAKFDALVATEASEDVEQNASLEALRTDLADARANTDSVVTEMETAAVELTDLTDKVNSLGAQAAVEPGLPVEEPVVVPAEPEEPVVAPVEVSDGGVVVDETPAAAQPVDARPVEDIVADAEPVAGDNARS